MHAWRLHELGEPTDVLRWEEVADPEPGPMQVVVDVAATALNFPDVLMCRGEYQEKPPLPFTPGLEVSGRISAVGEGVELQIGQRVIAMPMMPNGGLASKVLSFSPAVFAIPDSLDDTAAAALMITYQTGWFGLHRRAGLQPGEVLLVHAGAGGVGSAAIQLGKAAGATVIATAGGAEKVAVCTKLGADHAIDYSAEDFVERVKELTAGQGADVIYDPVGGDVFDKSRRCIAWEGRLLVIGFAGGRIPEVPANHVLLKNYSVVGLHWGAYSRRDYELVPACHAELMRLHAEGRIAPLVSAVRPIAEAPSALASLADRGTYGKIVVTPS
jgi:NADPH2:quinone reductase